MLSFLSVTCARPAMVNLEMNKVTDPNDLCIVYTVPVFPDRPDLLPLTLIKQFVHPGISFAIKTR